MNKLYSKNDTVSFAFSLHLSIEDGV